ncbi:MAG: prepilin-type N-terminal cleavage/methylation domain-containing protein [Burkholderiales bacterium]|nr:prepilin-type N-terminal cleavage/methylation domain-containing protein [Burkholderiales bacterium]
MATQVRTRGFTLIEICTVMMVLAVLAVMVLPRLMGRRDVDTLALHDRALAMVRYAQKVAVAQDVPVFVVTAGNALSLCFDAACSAPVADPAGSGPLGVQAGSAGLTLTSSATLFSFDGLGRPSTAPVVFTIGGVAPARTFTVEQETGYAHP